jgi:FkbH-like protein
MMHDANCIPLYGCLSDRFGDHGLISVIVARPDPRESVLDITDWLMSCRVLASGVEEYLMNYVVQEAVRLNLDFVAGTYTPTVKNGMVRDFFSRFAFEKRGQTQDGSTLWRLPVADYQYLKTYIQPAIAQCESLAREF